MKNLKTQLGTTVTADLIENTWTFELADDMRVRAGKFAILPLENYLDMMKLLEHWDDLDPDESMSNEDFKLMHETLEKLRNHGK